MKHILPLIFIFSNFLLSSEVNVTGLKNKTPERVLYIGNSYLYYNEILENCNIKKIFHFGRADLGFLKQHLDINVKNIFDTKIASKICRKFSPHHGLKDLCRDLININLSKEYQTSDWGKKIEEYKEEQISYGQR